MADLLKSFHQPEAHVGSSVFDLSCKRVFSGKAGQCLPAFVNETVPGDKFEIDMAAMCRTNTLETPAFLRGKFNYDFFFVPYVQVWHRFNDFVSQKIDLHTSYYRNGPCVSTPMVSLKQLVRLLLNNAVGNPDHYYTGPYSLSGIADTFRLLDLLGYGNYLPILEECYHDGDPDSQLMEHYLSDYFHNDAVPVQQPHDIDEPGDYYVNLFRLAAYQHIWYDFYRNKYFDNEGYGSGSIDNYQDYFNLDDIDTSSIASARFNTPNWDNPAAFRLYGMCTLRYCQWKKDIYTALMPSQQFGVVSSVDFLSNRLVSSDGSVLANAQALVHQNGYLQRSTNVSNNTAPSQWVYRSVSIQNSFDILSLRRAEALQKWKEAAIRAGNMNDKNQKAHFGVEPYYYEDNNVHFLGSYDGTLQLNPVAATANAQSQSGVNKAVGDLAASATAVANGEKIHFDCRDYGILMCIARFVPESEYSSDGIELANTRFEPYDYYNPEFANLGLQSVPLYQQSLNGDIQANKNMSLGYAPRDYDYKQNVDKVYGEFATLYPDSAGAVRGVFANWVSPRRDQLVYASQNTAGGRNKASFYVDPKVLDSVFGKQADAWQFSDQFVFNAYFDIKAVRKMPVLGLPEF